jgi:hypothetical protein
VLAEQLEEMFGIHTTFSTSALAAPTLSAAVVVNDTGYAIDMGERLMSTAGFVVQSGDEFDGQQIHALREYLGIVVVAVQRAGHLFIVPQRLAAPGAPGNGHSAAMPPFEGVLYPGDEVIVLADISIIDILRRRGASSGIRDISITGRATLTPTAADAGGQTVAPPRLPAIWGGVSGEGEDTQHLLEYLLHNGETAPPEARPSDRPQPSQPEDMP